MLFIGIILSLGLLGLIIYFAFSNKSSRILKLSAIGALALICLALIVCGFILIFGGGSDEDQITLPVFADAAPQQERAAGPMDIILLLVFLFGLAIVIYVAMKREKERKKAMTPSLSNVPLKFTRDPAKKDDSADSAEDDAFDFDDLDLN